MSLMRILVLSDSLPIDTGYSHAEVYRWMAKNQPLISNYEILVLDTKMPRDTRTPAKVFYGITEEIIKLLKAGGVVICLTYAIAETEAKKERYRIVHDDPPRRGKWTTTRVTNYDWLPFEILEATELYRRQNFGTDFRLKKKSEEFKRYFDNVKIFHKVIEGGVFSEDKKEWKFQYFEYLKQSNELLLKSCDMEVIAVNHVTGDPIACVIYYQGGSLIFLPQSDLTPSSAVYFLFEIGKKYYELNIEKLERSPEIPEWIDNYKTEQEKTIDDKISELKEELQNEKSKRSRFQKINALLYATDKILEKAGMLVFEDFNFNVKKADIGSNKDLIIEDDSGNRLLVEVTGVKGKINSKTRKITQLWDLVLEKESNEKIVLIANTYREKDPIQRSGEENFTEKVMNLCEKNDICLMTTFDLFNLWKDFLKGKKTPKQVINSILNTNGVYEQNN
jgi:hypothetical protein